jgi:hypothetical protein
MPPCGFQNGGVNVGWNKEFGMGDMLERYGQLWRGVQILLGLLLAVLVHVSIG